MTRSAEVIGASWIFARTAVSRSTASPQLRPSPSRPSMMGSTETQRHDVRKAKSAAVRGVRPSPMHRAVTPASRGSKRSPRCARTAAKQAKLSDNSLALGKSRNSRRAGAEVSCKSSSVYRVKCGPSQPSTLRDSSGSLVAGKPFATRFAARFSFRFVRTAGRAFGKGFAWRPAQVTFQYCPGGKPIGALRCSTLPLQMRFATVRISTNLFSSVAARSSSAPLAPWRSVSAKATARRMSAEASTNSFGGACCSSTVVAHSSTRTCMEDHHSCGPRASRSMPLRRGSSA
mmetsp:Transcript_61721/g.177699  ORF Transcript_61721/g.177699 Transcript_61721/m.177699 type:complete len:288 (-) Transcript_61721:40-903(-)